MRKKIGNFQLRGFQVMQAERQTDKERYSSQYFAPYWAQSNKQKPKQSYWHANSTLCNTVNLTFDLRVNACWGPALEYTCTKFDVDSSSYFSFRARTHTDTDATDHSAHALPTLLHCCPMYKITWQMMYTIMYTNMVQQWQNSVLKIMN